MNNSLDVLFLGRLFPEDKELEKRIRSKIHFDMQDAANVLQWNLINGIIKNGYGKIGIVSYLPVDSWPKYYDDAFVKQHKYVKDGYVEYLAPGFCNITYIKQIFSDRICKDAVMKWASKKNNGCKKVIVCYSCNTVLMKAVASAKKKHSDIKTIQIIADIPEYATNDNPNGIRALFYKHIVNKYNRLKEHIDSYVLLTEQMKDKLKITKPYIVMEGICSEREYCEKSERTEDFRTILYTGSMNRKYGILILLKAFSLINDQNYRLVLCGLGNAEPEILDYCLKDKRITFFGKVSHNEVLELQCGATVLVNPRENNEEFTKYSFPSKTMEYLASGTPVVAFKLDGIPDEYDKYINYVAKDTPEALAEKIKEICELPQEERIHMGEKSREFVIRHKNAVMQTKRILDFIEKI